jgi:SAM-dependent methyltransferase
VASDQNQDILRLVDGRSILEVGCGYGTFVREARENGKVAFGLDINLRTLQTGSKFYPSIEGSLIQGDMERLPFKQKTFDTILLRESLHHVSWEKVLPEILRICRTEILIFEPNPNGFLRLCRRIISHQDQEVPLEPLLALLRSLDVAVKQICFRDLFAFPLSGGFVGWELIPPVKILFPFLLRADRILHSLFRLLRVERSVSWRYLLKGGKNEAEEKR